jgi:dipeptidase D
MNRLLFDGFDNFGLQISEIKAGVYAMRFRESQAKVIIAEVYDEALFLTCKQIVNEIKKRS